MHLDDRKQKILGAVVRDYIETVRPVGSEDLAVRHSWGVKSATIRHELAELSDLGYLRQPHTSAGRIPSDQGYRFYVDHLMEMQNIEPLTSHPSSTDQALELDRVLRRTCSMLTRMTSYTSVATPPRPANTLLDQIFLSPAGENRLLLVILLSTGQLEKGLLPGNSDIAASDIISICNALNAAYAGKTIDSHIAKSERFQSSAPREFTPNLRSLFDSLSQTILQMLQSAANEDNIYLEGTHEILRQPEFRDVSKIEGVLDALQNGNTVFQTLTQALLRSQVTVVIGMENYVAAMQECSVVTASYYVGTREKGTIGVVGPTRMNYDRAVPAVNFFAHSLSQTLTRLSA